MTGWSDDGSLFLVGMGGDEAGDLGLGHGADADETEGKPVGAVGEIFQIIVSDDDGGGDEFGPLLVGETAKAGDAEFNGDCLSDRDQGIDLNGHAGFAEVQDVAFERVTALGEDADNRTCVHGWDVRTAAATSFLESGNSGGLYFHPGVGHGRGHAGGSGGARPGWRSGC
jgi:hypothetical protein